MTENTDDKKPADKLQAIVHTPGPWRVDTTVARGAYGVWSDNCQKPGLQSQVCSVIAGNMSDFPREMRDANARLIAAAPELKEILQEARDTMLVLTSCYAVDLVKRIDVALAKVV